MQVDTPGPREVETLPVPPGSVPGPFCFTAEPWPETLGHQRGSYSWRPAAPILPGDKAVARGTCCDHLRSALGHSQDSIAWEVGAGELRHECTSHFLPRQHECQQRCRPTGCPPPTPHPPGNCNVSYSPNFKIPNLRPPPTLAW